MGFLNQLKVFPRFGLTLCLVASCAASQAQDQSDFESEESSVDWFGDLRLRYDNVDFPQVNPWTPSRETISRGRGSLRAGVRFFASDSVEMVLAAKLNGGTDSNRDNIPRLDNERSNDFTLAQAYINWWIGNETEFRVGKSEFQPVLTPMVWDRDIAPAGVSIRHVNEIRDFDQLEWVIGYFSGEHEFDSRPNVGVAQLSWLIQPGAQKSGEITATYLAFDQIDTIVSSGIGRTNSKAFGQLTEDYRMLDLQLAYRWRTGTYPWLLRTDLIHNFGASDDNDGIRAELVGGNASMGGWEFGLAWQRVQQDAVLAAFNEDDWWFPSNMRGTMPWISYGFSEGLWLRGAAFIERRDDMNDNLERLMLDLNWVF